jgi:hypothetical protein
MASGYEKAACGVDPNKGWGKPSRRERWFTALVPAIAVLVVCGGIALSLWRALVGG